jgi:ABC-type amino acid transport system permease subunit
MWVYFGVLVALGLEISALESAVACLAAQEAAYLAEIYRAGIQAIPKTQKDAALSLGLTPLQTFKEVVFPQALRIVVPAIGNDFIGILKGSSLVSILGVYELMRAAQSRGNYFFRPFEFLSAAAVIYIVVALGLGRLVSRLEKRLDSPGLV